MADQEVLANFLAITGASEAEALSLLEAAGFQLEEAVNLFFAAGDDFQGGAAFPLPPSQVLPPPAAAFEDDEALARRLQE
jgi:hypothetical protein